MFNREVTVLSVDLSVCANNTNRKEFRVLFKWRSIIVYWIVMKPMITCMHTRAFLCCTRPSIYLTFSWLFLTLTLCENVWKGNVIQVSSFRAQQIVYMQMKNCMSASHVNKAQVTASLQYGSWKFSGGKRSGPVLALARPYHRADLYSNILCHYKWQSCQHDASIISTFSIHVVEIYSARPFCILKF